MAPDRTTGASSSAFRTVAVLGAGNGGKAVSADLALQGLHVLLFEWPEYGANVEGLRADPVIEVSGVLTGEAKLGLVTSSLPEAIDQADVIIPCVQGLAHARLAVELGPLIWDGAIILLNPGSSGGSLELRRIFGELGIDKYVVLAETGTLTHCARAVAHGGVHIGLRVNHIAFAALPGAATVDLLPTLEPLFPGLKPKQSVLEVALCNGNPVIHPAIVVANAGVIEHRGEDHRFYAEGVTPAVARIIQAVDLERIALGKALGYDLLTEPEMSVQQGYATSTDYHECYAESPVFAALASPSSLEHRYLHEDCGLGLVTYVSLGQMLGVATPMSAALVQMAGQITGRKYLADGRRTVQKLGIAGLSPAERQAFLDEPMRV